MIDDFLKIRRIWVQPFRKLRPTDARCAMAIRAVMCGECLGTSLDARRIVDGGGGPILGMAIDRRRANLDQRPTDDCRVLDGTGDTIKAPKKNTAALMPKIIASAPTTARIRIFVSDVLVC